MTLPQTDLSVKKRKPSLQKAVWTQTGSREQQDGGHMAGGGRRTIQGPSCRDPQSTVFYLLAVCFSFLGQNKHNFISLSLGYGQKSGKENETQCCHSYSLCILIISSLKIVLILLKGRALDMAKHCKPGLTSPPTGWTLLTLQWHLPLLIFFKVLNESFLTYFLMCMHVQCPSLSAIYLLFGNIVSRQPATHCEHFIDSDLSRLCQSQAIEFALLGCSFWKQR